MYKEQEIDNTPNKEQGPQNIGTPDLERMNNQDKNDPGKEVRELAITMAEQSSTPSQEDSEEEVCHTQQGRDI